VKIDIHIARPFYAPLRSWRTRRQERNTEIRLSHDNCLSFKRERRRLQGIQPPLRGAGQTRQTPHTLSRFLVLVGTTLAYRAPQLAPECLDLLDHFTTFRPVFFLFQKFCHPRFQRTSARMRRVSPHEAEGGEKMHYAASPLISGSGDNDNTPSQRTIS
jgi:hypothetical protein